MYTEGNPIGFHKWVKADNTKGIHINKIAVFETFLEANNDSIIAVACRHIITIKDFFIIFQFLILSTSDTSTFLEGYHMI
jgi:hypothetical protein